MLVLAQSNRDGFKRAQKLNGAYDLRAISEANELERSAMKVYSIYTSEDLKLAKEAEMQCLKNRTGETMMDPLSVFVDPVTYVAGEEVEGFNDVVSADELGGLFDDVDELGGLGI